MRFVPAALLLIASLSPIDLADDQKPASDIDPMVGCGTPEAPPKPSCAETPPRLLHSVDPGYTSKARKAKVEGTVALKIVVGVDGKVSTIRVVRSLGMGLDEQAVKSVKKWKFKPGEHEGKPVPVTVNVEINFRLT